MAATVTSLVVSKIILGHLPIMPFVSGIVVVIFGSLSIYLQNETFIKMKPTIVNALFGGVLLGGLAFGKSLLGYVFDSVFKLTDEGWKKLTFRWGLFFFALAILNEVVWRTVSTDTWVDFKVFGIMPLTFLFTMTQLPLIMRTTVPEEKAKP
jgi:intracellular septation protein